MNFKTLILVILLGVWFLNPPIGQAELTSFLSDSGPHDNGLWLVDPEMPEIYGSVGPESTNSRWHIAQWGNMNRLSPDWNYRPHGEWFAKENGNITIQSFVSPREGRTLKLSHDTLAPAFGCNTEFDLLLEPNDVTYSNYPQGFATYNATPPLSSITTLRLRGFQGVLRVRRGNRCGTPFDAAGTILAVVFVNYTSPIPQGFFYQVSTYDSRPDDYAGWFFAGEDGQGFNIWGYAEYSDHYGYTELVPGKSGNMYDVDIGPRVKDLISSAPGDIDGDLSHWKVKGMYAGSWLNGEAEIVSVVDSVDLLYE
jgi:hypothetical protein